MTDTPKTWSEMTPEEKGALLLAHHEGAEIQTLYVDPNGAVWFTNLDPNWLEGTAYRVKPEPKRKPVTLYGDIYGPCKGFSGKPLPEDTHCITFDLIDGEPDCDSIKMEKL